MLTGTIGRGPKLYLTATVVASTVQACSPTLHILIVTKESAIVKLGSPVDHTGWAVYLVRGMVNLKTLNTVPTIGNVAVVSSRLRHRRSTH